MNDDFLTPEEQERLYRDRERMREAEECDVTEMGLVPDVDPVIPAEKCGDDEESLSVDFLNPNPAPELPGTPSLLPEPLTVPSRAVSISCPAGQVAISGEDPSEVAAGADIQLVYLDEIEGISQPELFRLATYVAALQAHVSGSLVGAINSDDFAAFDAGIVGTTKTTSAVAAKIREALVVAQERADQVAQTIALAGLVCGWRNQELWVICQVADPGYTFVSVDPGELEKAHVAAGLFSSSVSQSDANAQAALSAALELSCLVTNTEQDVSCSDVEGEVSESLTLTWPVNWNKASSARDAATGAEVVTLEDQGAGAWDASDWDAHESQTETIALGALNGQEFMQANQVGSPARRRLRTRVIIKAGDPRTAAPDLATANAIAYNLAVAELDCFVPNRPRIISCVTDVFGSSEVAARHAALGLGDDNVGRGIMFEELRGGDPETYGGPDYTRTNVGVADYGSSSEQEDRTPAFEVYVWPGYFAGISVPEVESTAGNHAAGLLLCAWMSPAHGCQCASSEDAAGMTSVTGVGQVSAKFSTDFVAGNAAVLSINSPEASNSLPRGLVVDSDYPNKTADPGYSAAPLAWPGLPAICQAGLDCLFEACKITCCEPKPDNRPYLVNGMPNYASWTDDRTKPATLDDHTAFMDAWDQARLASAVFGCPGYQSADDCNIGSPPAVGSIVEVGPSDGAYGMPARFKYGGLLRWGNQWQETSPPDANGNPSNDLSLVGRVKECHKDPGHLQTADPWGLFHCAEGYAEGPSPAGLGEQARQNSLSRLDCTHISWPRHLVACPEPNQRPFAPPRHLNVVIEGGSTREANEQLENLILQLMACRDTHNFMLTFKGGGGGSDTKLEMPSPTVVSSGGCLPPGLSEAKIYKENCKDEVDLDNLPANESSHVFIIVRCCEIDPKPPEKRLILRVIPDSSIDAEIRSEDGRQVGRMGLPSGRQALATLRLDDPEVWYIGSYSVVDLGHGKHQWEAGRQVVQAHSGPIVVGESCCDEAKQWKLRVSGNEADNGNMTAQMYGGTLSGLGLPGYIEGYPADTWTNILLDSQVWLKLTLSIEGVQVGYGEGSVFVPGKVVDAVAQVELRDANSDLPVPQAPTVNGNTGASADPGVYWFHIGTTKASGQAVNHYEGPLNVGWCAPNSATLIKSG